MRFSKYFDKECIPEWRKAYVDYQALKRQLMKIKAVSKICSEIVNNGALTHGERPQQSLSHADSRDESSLCERVKPRLRPITSWTGPHRLWTVSMHREARRKSNLSVCLIATWNESPAFTTASGQDTSLFLSKKKFLNDSLLEKEKECKEKLRALRNQVEIVEDYGHAVSALRVWYSLSCFWRWKKWKNFIRSTSIVRGQAQQLVFPVVQSYPLLSTATTASLEIGSFATSSKYTNERYICTC